MTTKNNTTSTSTISNTSSTGTINMTKLNATASPVLPVLYTSPSNVKFIGKKRAEIGIQGLLSSKVLTKHDLKRKVESCTSSHFFSHTTMRYFGDTMRNYNLTMQHGKGRVYKAYTHYTTGTETPANLCYELTRTQSVNGGLCRAEYFDIFTFERVLADSVEPQINESGETIYDCLIVDSVASEIGDVSLKAACTFIYNLFVSYDHQVEQIRTPCDVTRVTSFLQGLQSEINFMYMNADILDFYELSGFDKKDSEALTTCFFEQLAISIIFIFNKRNK